MHFTQPTDRAEKHSAGWKSVLPRVQRAVFSQYGRTSRFLAGGIWPQRWNSSPAQPPTASSFLRQPWAGGAGREALAGVRDRQGRRGIPEHPARQPVLAARKGLSPSGGLRGRQGRKGIPEQPGLTACVRIEEGPEPFRWGVCTGPCTDTCEGTDAPARDLCYLSLHFGLQFS